MAQSIKLGSDTYLDASGVVMSNHETIDTQRTNCVKFPDGTMIQWGYNTIAANSTRYQLSYPTSFLSGKHVSFVAIPAYSTTRNVSLSFGADSYIGVDVYRSDPTTSAQPFMWIAIGKWK